MRNLARGYSRRQLGISALQEQRLRAQHHLEKMRQRMAGALLLYVLCLDLYASQGRRGW